MAHGAVFGIRLAQRGKHRVVMAGEDQIAVNFISNDENIVLQTDVAHPLQLLPRVDAAHGVMRIAEDKGPAHGVGGLALEIRKVDLIPPIPQDQRTADDLPLLCADGISEGVIDRLLNEHTVPLLCLGLN